MTLREAILAAARPAHGAPYRLQLCCGFEPLHLVSFLKGHLAERLRGAGPEQSRPVAVSTGVFGDLPGNVERALAAEGAEPLAVVVEWTDVDPRLGLREGYRPALDLESSIIGDATARLSALERLLTGAAAGRRIVLALPATPLPPWLPALAGQASAFTLGLKARLAGFAAACAAAGVRVAEPLSGAAYELRTHLLNGFPYVTAHADLLAASLAGLLLPPAPAKGLITDLDNTVWAGIVGDDGPSNVHWSLEKHARVHGLYQQLLAGLAAQGVLVGVASKNDPGPVAEALARADLLLPSESLFPVETHWGPKSESIRRIARAWNIGLDAIVFVDDNPIELEEVRQAIPEVECHLFPSGDSNAALELFGKLRARFAREKVTEEDRLRAASLRNAAQLEQESLDGGGKESLLSGLEARITLNFAQDPFDPRSLELLNKTNQFNLNGRRWEESEFRAFLSDPKALLAVVSYEDRFGALGKIAVAAGLKQDDGLYLKSWVMSCRAFSRRIEYSTLRALFERSGAGAIRLDWQATARNNPVRQMLDALCGPVPDSGPLALSREHFDRCCPALYAAVS